MSNHLAVATVTTVLRDLLQAAIQEVVPGVEMTTRRPSNEDTVKGPRCNIFLYQVAPNPVWRNTDLPTRSTDGRLLQNPCAALDLYYLISFYGDEVRLEPQRMLGQTVQVLHTQPLLTPERIQASIRMASEPGGGHFLAASDLAAQVEKVTLTPLSLSLEELSKLWSVFFQAPYALSVSYAASIVMIDAGQTPLLPQPVQQRSIFLLQFRQPSIERVQSADGPLHPVTSSGAITLTGMYLQQPHMRVRIGTTELQPVAGQVSDQQLTISLPDTLRAGVQPVQVVHQLDMNGTLRRQTESNVVAFVLHPVITQQQVRNNQIEVRLNPPAASGQRVLLFLNELNPPDERPARFYILNIANGGDSGASETATLSFDAADVVPGDYLIRVQVDGAESVQEVDSTSRRVTGPTIRIGGITP